MEQFLGGSTSFKSHHWRKQTTNTDAAQRRKPRMLLPDAENQHQQEKSLEESTSSLSSEHYRRCVCLPNNYTPTSFPAIWSELRQKEELCDGLIRCANDRDFRVHRLILSAASPYFRASFANWLNHELVLPDVEADMLEVLLDYAYTGACVVNASNVERLLPLADRLEVMGVVRLCCRFLIDQLTPDNCLGICKFAAHYFCHDLEERGRRYICQNFKYIFRQSAEFKSLSTKELEQILKDDELNVSSEKLVFEAIKTWVEVHPADRIQHLPRLLGCIRYGLLEPQYFRNTILAWQLAQTQECRRILLSITAYLEKRARKRQTYQPILEDELARPRVPYEVLFTMGGWCFNWVINYVETYDVRANRWLISSCKDETPRAYHGLCVLDNLIYVIGGCDGRRHLNTVRCFDPASGQWQERACMHHARCFVSVCTYGGKIYALGGNNSLMRLSSCERYEPETNQWQLIAPMHMPRSDASACALNGRLYVAGGYNGQYVYDSVEVYDVATGLWNFIAPMWSVRTGHSLVAHQGCIYAIGGFDGDLRLNSCEKYDPNRPHGWQEIAEMRSRRSSFTTAILDDMIFAIGGYDGLLDPKTLSQVEYYDAEQNKWYKASPMILGRSALSACVVAGLKNARKYTYHQLEVKSSVDT